MRLFFIIYNKETDKSCSDMFLFHITNSFSPDNLWIVQKHENESVAEFSSGDFLKDENRLKNKIHQVLFGYIKYKDYHIEVNGFLYMEQYLGEFQFVLKNYEIYKDGNNLDRPITLEGYPNSYNEGVWEVIDLNMDYL